MMDQVAEPVYSLQGVHFSVNGVPIQKVGLRKNILWLQKMYASGKMAAVHV